MMKLGFAVILFLTFHSAFSQNSLFLEKTGIAFQDKEQLQDLYLQYNQSMLIVEGLVYLLPCDCSPCRNKGGDKEGRNGGGDTEGRNAGGEGDGRNLGGENNGRNLGGDADGRNLGGNGEGRNLGGDSDLRNQGGESDGRNLGGENDGRNLGGDADGRNQGGESDGRNQGGEGEGRNAGAEADSRMGGGELSSFGCERKSRNKFQLFAINKNAEVYYFDGFELIKVDMSKGLVKL